MFLQHFPHWLHPGPASPPNHQPNRCLAYTEARSFESHHFQAGSKAQHIHYFLVGKDSSIQDFRSSKQAIRSAGCESLQSAERWAQRNPVRCVSHWRRFPSPHHPEDVSPYQIVTFSACESRSINRRLFSIDTSLNGLIFGDQFLQFVTRLPSKNLYGFGENYHKRFRLDQFDYTTRPIFTRDQALGDVSDNGSFHSFHSRNDRRFSHRNQ